MISFKKSLSLAIISLFFFIAGVLHFTHDEFFVLIVPPLLKFPYEIVWFTGILEIIFAVGLLIPRLRLVTGFLLSIYCLAVLPANIYMAMENMPIMGEYYPILLILRIPLQFLLIAWILWASGGLKLIKQKISAKNH